MNVDCILTFESYKEALRLDKNATLGSQIAQFVVTKAAPVLAFACILILVFAHNLLVPFSPGALMVLLSVGYCLSLPFIERSKARQQFASIFPRENTERNIKARIDAEGIEIQTPCSSLGMYKWESISEIMQNESVILFYVGKSRFLFFPLSAFTPAQCTELNDLVARHVVKR